MPATMTHSVIAISGLRTNLPIPAEVGQTITHPKNQKNKKNSQTP